MGIRVPEIGPDLSEMDQIFAAQIDGGIKLSHENGRRDAFNEVLKWATANRDALVRAGLAESLLRLCGI